MKNLLINVAKACLPIGREFIKVIIIVAIAVPFISLFAAWTEPTAAPTGGNADAPINVGSSDQIKNYETDGLGNLIPGKSGGLGVGAFFSRFGTLLATDGGNVGIGQRDWLANPPTEKLDVEGGIRIGNTTTNNEGTIRYNQINKDLEGYVDGSWRSLTKTDTQSLLERTRGQAEITYRDYSGKHERCDISFSSSVCNWSGSFGQNNHWDDGLCRQSFEDDWKNQNPCSGIDILRTTWHFSGDGGPVDIEYIKR